jgi:hypothetical protein
MSKDTVSGVIAGVILVVIAVVVSIVMPLLYAASGYFTGWVLSHIFPFAGEWIVRGALTIGVKLSVSDLPVIGALLGFIGAFFKAHQSNTNKK